MLAARVSCYRMSYDLTIAERAAGESWDDVHERLEREAGVDAPLSARRRAVWERTRDRLLAYDPAFEVAEEPDRMELTLERFGLELSLLEAQAGLSVPYWFQGEEADRVFGHVGGILDIVRDETGWSVWDRQLEEEILRAEQLREAARAMSAIAARVPGDIARLVQAAPMPPNRAPADRQLQPGEEVRLDERGLRITTKRILDPHRSCRLDEILAVRLTPQGETVALSVVTSAGAWELMRSADRSEVSRVHGVLDDAMQLAAGPTRPDPD